MSVCRPQHLQPAESCAGSRHTILCYGIVSHIGTGGAHSRPPCLHEEDHKEHQRGDCHAFFVATSGVDEPLVDNKVEAGAVSPERTEGP